uniref:Uncharacterized protein n=1 Tax=Theropithecus gelada TaxID=9565 RepID=A0A8D2EPQ2_THEGE
YQIRGNATRSVPPLLKYRFKNGIYGIYGRARWLKPYMHFGRPRRADHEVRRSRPSWLTR